MLENLTSTPVNICTGQHLRIFCQHLLQVFLQILSDITMTTLSLAGETEEIFSGVLHKVGGKVKTWNKRFFVLKSDYCLYYYKDTSKGALGKISLRDQKFEARNGKATDMAWPRHTKLDCTMAIVTSHRTYCVYCNYAHEIKEWIHMLTMAREKVAGEVASENKLLSRRSASSSQGKSQPEKPQLDPARSLSSGELQPESYETMYDSVGSKDPMEQNDYESQETEAVYALASSVEAEEEPVLYEDMSPTPKDTDTTTTGEASSPHTENGLPNSLRGSEPVYDDLIAQPLYEDIPLKRADKSAIDDEHDSDNDREHTGPSLPPRVDTPPSPPPRKDVLPSVPPRKDAREDSGLMYEDVPILYADAKHHSDNECSNPSMEDAPLSPPPREETLPSIPPRREDTHGPRTDSGPMYEDVPPLYADEQHHSDSHPSMEDTPPSPPPREKSLPSVSPREDTHRQSLMYEDVTPCADESANHEDHHSETENSHLPLRAEMPPVSPKGTPKGQSASPDATSTPPQHQPHAVAPHDRPVSSSQAQQKPVPKPRSRCGT